MATSLSDSEIVQILRKHNKATPETEGALLKRVRSELAAIFAALAAATDCYQLTHAVEDTFLDPTVKQNALANMGYLFFNGIGSEAATLMVARRSALSVLVEATVQSLTI